MPGPDPAVAATRVAVRRLLPELGSQLVVACSGGPDSLALAAAVAFETRSGPVAARAVVVDHDLQPDSARVAAQAAEVCRSLGLAAQVRRVEVVAGRHGLEAAARTARYAALHEAAELANGAEVAGGATVLLGHTRDDQAESVLLALARGSGIRAISAMAPIGPGPIARPFLDLPRQVTHAACQALGLRVWHDPHNEDPRFLRTRARRALTQLEADLDPGVVAGLARTAALARTDADHLDSLAEQAADQFGESPWTAEQLAGLPAAVRGRVWRLLMARSGATVSDVSSTHVGWLDALVTGWHGQGPVDIPGGLRIRRDGGLLTVVTRRVE